MVEFFMSLIGNLFGIASFQLASKQAKSKVISSLKDALRLTNKHIEETRQGDFGDIEFSDVQSKELSAAWSTVAEAIRPFDIGLAQTFEEKSDYWINPHGFRNDIQSGKRRFNYRFRLSEVKTELAKIENKGI